MNNSKNEIALISSINQLNLDKHKVQNASCENLALASIVLLELIIVLKMKGKNIEDRKVTIGLDNRKVCRGIVEEIHKISENARDVRTEIVEIKEILKRIKFEVEFKLTLGHAPMTALFARNPLQHIMKASDKEARRMRERCRLKDIETSIKYVGKCALQIGGNIATKLV